MTNLEQAARQALEALEYMTIGTLSGGNDRTKKAIAALRQALKQPTGNQSLQVEPVVVIDSVQVGGKVVGRLRKGVDAQSVIGKVLYTRLQPTDEPAAAQRLAEMIMSDCGCSTNNERLLERITARIGHYTRPQPPCEWVGLTDEEIWGVYTKVDSMQYMEFTRAIEAKLKEKNT